MNVAFCFVHFLKTEFEPHCITLPEFYMNLIKLGRETNLPDHPNIGLRRDNRPRTVSVLYL